MVRKLPDLNIPCVFFLLIGYFLCIFPACAEEYPADFSFKGLYKASFSGLAIGKIGVEFEQTASGYEATSDIQTSGILKIFTPHSSHSTVKASGKDFHINTIAYVTDYHTRRKQRHVDITYTNGRFKSENLVPPENPAKRPPVSAELKNNSLDPLSSLVMARRLLREALANGAKTFSLQTYDGRRLTKIDFTVVGKKVIRMFGVKTPVIQVNAKRTLMEGFTKSELADFDPNEPVLAMYFSNDEALFPVRLEAILYTSTLTADLFKRCAPNESCLLGNRN